MKKIINYIVITLLLFSVASCDKNDKTDSDIAGFYELTLDIVYPSGSYGTYYAEFNGQNISETKFYRNTEKGDLKIFPKDSNTPELIIEDYNIIETGAKIRLIKLTGQNIELYKEGDFVTLQNNIQFMSDNYKAVFILSEI